MIGYIVGTHYHYDCTEFDEPALLYLDRGDAETEAKTRDAPGTSGEIIEVLLPAPLTEDE